MCASVSPDAFFYNGMRYAGLPDKKIRSSIVNDRRFKSNFGVTPYTCSFLWDLIYNIIPDGGHFVHLLWGLMFLKVYATEAVHCGKVQCDEKTFRKWSWTVVKALALLKSRIVSKKNFLLSSYPDYNA